MSGSIIDRVLTALTKVLKTSVPSRKKGRFSGKKIGKRWLAVTTNWSDSTCAKSGFNAKSRVMLGVRLYLPVRPRSILIGSLTNLPVSSRPELICAGVSVPFRFPVSETVILGINSSVRSVDIPSRPEMCPSWDIQPESARSIGIQLSNSLLMRLMRR